MKCRFFLLHPSTNSGKVDRLEALHTEYVAYVRACVQYMLDHRIYALARAEKQAFFPPAEALTSQIEKNARDHAIDIVSTWAKSVHARTIRAAITELHRDGALADEDAKALYTIGRKRLNAPWRFVTQEHLDVYHALLDARGGRPPAVPDGLPMRLSEMTARLEDAGETVTADFWLRLSSLVPRQSIWLPLVGNPYVQHAEQVSKGILARKTRDGRWRFEAVEKEAWEIPAASPDAPRIGIDVGLNVLAAASDGTLYGQHVKPAFDALYERIKRLRANRQRQGLREDSPRLARLEARLTGMVKTETGRAVNALVQRHPDAVFVVEYLDLRGCRGQKRFAYRALQASLERKAPVEKVNPAYTSQECPSCGYVHRGNRSGTRFVCRCCGRRAHADWVGASGILRRSEDKGAARADHPRDVKRVLSERFRSSRTSSSGLGRRLPPSSSLPLDRRLTTEEARPRDIGTVSNSMAI